MTQKEMDAKKGQIKENCVKQLVRNNQCESEDKKANSDKIK